MKYIRTKDSRIYQVYDKVFEYKGDKRYQLVDSRFEISLNDVVKQANTIEELCDELVFEWHRSSISHDNDTWHLYHKVSLKEEVENALNDGFRASIEEVKNIYGAIWTNKGLIYVAKMNDKGEIELL